MALAIVVLEDDDRRTVAMRDWLRDRFPMYRQEFFRDATSLVRWLQHHLAEAVAISLDHDLELIVKDDGTVVDSGTGREVAEFLSERSPICPVLIHSSNSPAALGMKELLEAAHWTVTAVSPYEDLRWIVESWGPALRYAIVGSAVAATSATAG